jgi:integrase
VTEHYLTYAKRELRSYKDVENRVRLRLIPTFGKKPLTRITKRDISDLHLRLRDEISAVSANRYLAQMSGIFTRAIDTGHAKENPARGIPKFRENGPRKRVLASEELSRFGAELNKEVEAGNLSAKAIYLLLVTGLRKMEVLSLRWEHVDLDNQTAYLPQTKSGKPRHVFLNSAAVTLLRDMREKRGNSPFVFPSGSKTGHMHEVRRTLSAVMRQAKIENLRLHDLRRSYASLLVNSGVDIFTIRDLLGHADVRTTQQAYAHLGSSTLRKATEVAAVQIGSALR